MIGFLTAAWLMDRISPRDAIIGATLATGCGRALTAITTQLDLLIALRMLQGFAGGVLLVAGRAILFMHGPRSQQLLIQALFAVGAVVAPAAIAPALLFVVAAPLLAAIRSGISRTNG